MNKNRPQLAETYRFVNIDGDYPTIDGQMFPWFVSDRGPLVEQVDPGMHILWVPVVVAAPMPAPPVGTPDAQPVADDGGARRIAREGAHWVKGTNRLYLDLDPEGNVTVSGPLFDDLLVQAGWVQLDDRTSAAVIALRNAAAEARERGDIGKAGGPDVWDWLHGWADRLESAAVR